MANLTNKILVALDFHEQSLDALEHAIRIAKSTNAQLVLMHVLERPDSISKFFDDDELAKKVEDGAAHVLEETKKRLAVVDNLQAETRMVFGKPYQKILELAKELQPLFIVMGKTASPSLGMKTVGSNTFNVIKESSTPVVSVRGDKVSTTDLSYQDIVIPLDLMHETCEQVTAAIEYGKRLNAKVKVMTVLTQDSIGLQLKLEHGLRKIKQIIEQAGVACQTTLVKPLRGQLLHQSIIAYAEQERAQLIIMMTQTESAFVSYFVGSTAQEVINKSSIPVMSVIPWHHHRGEDSVFNSFVDPLGVLAK